jgi:hypothetical protein
MVYDDVFATVREQDLVMVDDLTGVRRASCVVDLGTKNNGEGRWGDVVKAGMRTRETI